MAASGGRSEFELVINLSDETGTAWWTPEAAGYLCELCGKRGSQECGECLNAGRWCG